MNGGMMFLFIFFVQQKREQPFDRPHSIKDLSKKYPLKNRCNAGLKKTPWRPPVGEKNRQGSGNMQGIKVVDMRHMIPRTYFAIFPRRFGPRKMCRGSRVSRCN